MLSVDEIRLPEVHGSDSGPRYDGPARDFERLARAAGRQESGSIDEAGYQKGSTLSRASSRSERPDRPRRRPRASPENPVEARPPSELLATGPSGEMPSAMDLARLCQPFGLYTQRGSGQLLFDIGVSGDFVGSLTSNGVQRSNTCTFTGGCNRVFPRTAEIDLFGQIDPYARAMVIFSAGEEFESGSGDLNARLEEAYLSSSRCLSAPKRRWARCSSVQPPQPGPRARSASDGSTRRAHPILRPGGPQRVGRGADLGGAVAVLPGSGGGHLQWPERDRLRVEQLSPAARYRSPPNLLRFRRAGRTAARRVCGLRLHGGRGAVVDLGGRGAA